MINFSLHADSSQFSLFDTILPCGSLKPAVQSKPILHQITTIMSEENKKQNRRKFIGWGLVSAAALTAFRFVMPSQANKSGRKETVKMLTQDGKLVEVDVTAFHSSPRKQVSNQELQNWIKK